MCIFFENHWQKLILICSLSSFTEAQYQISINLIDHSKSIKPQHLSKSRLHLTKKGTSILSSTFIREIKNIFQWQSLLHSHQNVSTSFNSAEYKSKIANQNINNTNLQNICRKNINKLIFAHLNITRYVINLIS